jgi:hypothetical protein
MTPLPVRGLARLRCRRDAVRRALAGMVWTRVDPRHGRDCCCVPHLLRHGLSAGANNPQDSSKKRQGRVRRRSARTSSGRGEAQDRLARVKGPSALREWAPVSVPAASSGLELGGLDYTPSTRLIGGYLNPGFDSTHPAAESLHNLVQVDRSTWHGRIPFDEMERLEISRTPIPPIPPQSEPAAPWWMPARRRRNAGAADAQSSQSGGPARPIR